MQTFKYFIQEADTSRRQGKLEITKTDVKNARKYAELEMKRMVEN